MVSFKSSLLSKINDLRGGKTWETCKAVEKTDN